MALEGEVAGHATQGQPNPPMSHNGQQDGLLGLPVDDEAGGTPPPPTHTPLIPLGDVKSLQGMCYY